MLKVLPQAKLLFTDHVRRWSACTQCPIGGMAHYHVAARGTIPCDILFIGEAPGKTEDVTGQPFVGRAGKLLDAWVEATASLDLKWTYAITNVTMCRPCDRVGGPNRTPLLFEIRNCSRRLLELVKIAEPRGVVTLGRIAAVSVPELRDIAGIRLPILHLTHPAYLLRQGESHERIGPQSDEQIAALGDFVHQVVPQPEEV